MRIKLIRDVLATGFTLGKFYIDGNFYFYTVEDAVREVKIPKITAIPEGIYQILIKMSPHFHKMLPRLIGVPNFQGVLIHSGNTNEDTDGCIIVGMNRTENGVGDSRVAMNILQPKIQKALDDGETVTIEIESAI